MDSEVENLINQFDGSNDAEFRSSHGQVYDVGDSHFDIWGPSTKMDSIFRMLVDFVWDCMKTRVLLKHYKPDFQFRKEHGYTKPWGKELLEAAKHFPGCIRIAYSPPFLVVVWPKLPTKPWPLTFGGVPLFYGTKSGQMPPTHGCVGRSEDILTDLHQWLELFSHPKDRIKDVAKILVEDLGIDVRYFGWSGSHWFAKVVNADHGRCLPIRICGVVCMWQVFSDIHMSRRDIVPQEGAEDSTNYSPNWRLGVMLASEKSSTLRGIPVINPQGKRYVTIAAHGFPSPPTNVYHPVLSPDNVIGIFRKKLGEDSDIGLMELKHGLSYLCQSFEDGELVDLIKSDDLELQESIFLDSPFSGRCEGVVIAMGVIVTGSQYLDTKMVYFGNGMDVVLAGTCSSAMWTRGRRVASLFRFYDEKNSVAFCPSLDELIRAGCYLDSIA